MGKPEKVLLTGGSGVVGSALIPVLLEQGFSVLALKRKRALSDNSVETLIGDVTIEHFGLDLETLREEHGDITCVIHSAAVTNFDTSDNEMYSTNVGGTLNAISVANKLGARLIYVSTAFTHDLNLPPYLKEYSSYCQSKRKAESCVRDFANDYTIVRPSIVVGDSNTGEIAYFQGLHKVVEALLLGIAPMMPTEPDAFVDTVPQDILARAITALVRHGGREREYWVTRGGDAHRIGAIYEVLERFLKTYKQDGELPKIVNPEIIDRLFKPVFLPGLPVVLRKRLNSLVDYACYFNLSSPFPCNYNELAAEFSLDHMPPQDTVLVNNLNYWASQTGFKDKVA